jgi:alkylation response protein AidB-like acyl-CoA dehydrogenase
MIGPAIERFGTDEQKKKYLPGLWSGEITCALGYSEPNAGTDLASLETRAVRDGDEWVINGQKMWTSGAHMSTHVWLAVRTEPDAPKHRGVSMMIVPLDTPGISVRPLRGMSGIRTNETFYENVRVPADVLIGEENRGWYIAANALDHERVSLAPFSPFAREFDRVIDYLKREQPDLLAQPRTRARLAELKVDLHIQRALRIVNAAFVERGETPTMEASMAKVWSSELRYRMNSTFMDLLGRYGALSAGSSDEIAPLGGEIERTYRGSPVLRFGGGTNEVQRNIIAQRGLGLPRT